MMSILIVAEHNQTDLSLLTASCVTAAQALSLPIDVLVIGHQCQSVAEQAAQIDGIARVRLADHSCYQHQLAENSASLIQTLSGEYDYILAPASTFGKNLLPRVAALCDVSPISDVTAICSPDTFTRPIYAGNAVATVKSTAAKKILTIRPTAFPAAEFGDAAVAIEAVDTVVNADQTTLVKRAESVSERPELTTAKRIVSGGRGLQNQENFKMLTVLADKLGAALGASRAAVDAGFVPNDWQVGQTGKIVAPELYIAVGISGAIQHIAGMKDSKVIVAINKDADAPIFEIADYGLVGDLFQIIPELSAKLDEK